MAINTEADAGYMGNYDPDLGLGAAGYEKATTAHAATLLGHLKSVGMTPASPGAKQVVDGIHKAAVDRLFAKPGAPTSNNLAQGTGNPGDIWPTGSNANSTPSASQGTSTGFMVAPRGR